MNMHVAINLLSIIFLTTFQLMAFTTTSLAKVSPKELPTELPVPLVENEVKKKAEHKRTMTKEERLAHSKKNGVNSGDANSTNENAGNENDSEPKVFEKKIIGKIGKWTALRANPRTNIVCYAVLYAEKTTRNTRHTTKEKPYLALHYFSEGRIRFAYYIGYNLLSGSSVNISIDSMQHKMTPHGEYAIADSARQDDEMLKALSEAERVMVRGEGENYSYSIDFYNVEGFGEVANLLRTNCETSTNNSSFKGFIPTKKDLKRL